MTPRRALRSALALCFLVPAAYSGFAQQPAEFRAGTSIVLVEAVVTGKNGNYPRDLTAKDFRLWQDGKEQAITGLSFAPKSRDPHFLVLFFDAAGMAPADKVRARQAVSRFIDANGAPDRLMSVVSYDGSLRIAQSFTDNAGRLKEALTRVESRASGTPATGDSDSRNMLQALGSLAKSLGVLPGRKTIVLLTGGIPSSGDVKSATNAAIEESDRSGVAIYPLNAQPVTSAVDRVQDPFRPRQLRTPQGVDDSSPVVQDPAASSQPLLQALASGTGGFFVRDADELLDGLQQIGQEQTEYYVLSYTPPESKEGSCHALRVKVDRGGTAVRARSSYCAVKPVDLIARAPVATDLEKRLTGPDAGNLKASIELPYFYVSSAIARVHLAMELSPTGLKFENVKGKKRVEINLLGIATSGNGAPGARFSDTLKVDFDNPAELEKFQQAPLHYEKDFKIAPGKYTFSLAFSSGGDDFGKIDAPLTIEPWNPAELALSSIVLSRQTRPADDLGLLSSLVEDQVPLVAAGTQFIPSGSPQFVRGEEGFFYLELYVPDPASVSMRVRLLDRATGQPKWDSGSIRPPTGRSKSSIPASASLRLDSLLAGSYLLEVTASDRSGKQVQRTADFEIK